MTRIGVIGSGNIGQAVGEAWRRAGHDVVYASRSPEPPRTVAIADAIAGAGVVLLALPGGAVPQLLAEHGPALDGRLVIDATNDIGAERLHHADAYGQFAPGARFVRAFNTLGFEMLTDPLIDGGPADLFWCGPEDASVERLIADVGLRSVRVGDIDAIDVVDGVARLWLTLVFRRGYPRRLAFRLLAERREAHTNADVGPGGGRDARRSARSR
jgi:8-hydroxy-5-deazaflavin:NADPH oxidoreductase